MHMWSKLLTSVIVLPSLVLAGCTTTPRYHAKATDRTDAAVVRGWKSGGVMFFTYTEIERIDGLGVSTFSREKAMVDPGLRTLSVAGTYAGGIGGIERYTARVDLNATLKAGHSYRVKAERSGELMTLWVEDEEMHEVVGERRSTNTTHWIKWL